MKFNFLIVLMLLSIVSCKKEQKTNTNGRWNLKNYSVTYFDLAGNTIKVI